MFAAAKALIAGQSVSFHFPKPAHLFHKAEHSCHLCYFGLVFLEAHGLYRWAALALLVFGAADFFVKVEPMVEAA